MKGRRTVMMRAAAAAWAVLTAAGCTIETSDNGPLDGLWQLTATDSLTGSRTRQDMRTSGVYWAVQAHLLEMRNVKGETPSLLFRFERQGSWLLLHDAVVSDRMAGDSMAASTDMLRPYGLTRTADTLVIATLEEERMVVASEVVRMEFRKY